MREREREKEGGGKRKDGGGKMGEEKPVTVAAVGGGEKQGAFLYFSNFAPAFLEDSNTASHHV